MICFYFFWHVNQIRYICENGFESLRGGIIIKICGKGNSERLEDLREEIGGVKDEERTLFYPISVQMAYFGFFSIYCSQHYF